MSIYQQIQEKLNDQYKYVEEHLRQPEYIQLFQQFNALRETEWKCEETKKYRLVESQTGFTVYEQPRMRIKTPYWSWLAPQLCPTYVDTITKLCDIIVTYSGEVSVVFHKDICDLHELLYHLDMMFHGQTDEFSTAIKKLEPQEKDDSSC